MFDNLAAVGLGPGYWGIRLITPASLFIFILVIIWSIAWKGAALWKAARNGQMYWFVALMFINTVGILEILYIYVFAKKTADAAKSTQGSTN